MKMRPIMPLGSKGIRVKLETIEVCSSEDEAETKRKPEKNQEVETVQGPEENDTSPNSAEEEEEDSKEEKEDSKSNRVLLRLVLVPQQMVLVRSERAGADEDEMCDDVS